MSQAPCILTSTDTVVAPLAHELFGQFMERASFGEPGPESACDQNGQLRPASLALLQDMAPPVIRFPGGTDIDYLDWHDLIDYAPTRTEQQRPPETGRNGKFIGTRFGLIEFLKFMDDMLTSEAILVVNIGAAWQGQTIDEQIAAVAHHCAAMLAFVNAPLDNNLPANLKAYPKARAKAGHPRPFAIKKWQIGNETWLLPQHFEGFSSDDPHWIDVQRDCLRLAIKQMKDIDPQIELIIDGGTLDQLRCNYHAFKDAVNYFSFHYYKPMGGPTLIDSRSEETVTSNTLSRDELYNWMLAAPESNADGYSAFDNETFQFIRKHQVPIAFTEWNWNGWFKQEIAENNWHWRGMGAAGILHALMRDSQHIKLACQSMLIGSGWGIMGIWVDPQDAFEPFMNPSGMVTSLYSQHHGDEIIAAEISNNQQYDAIYAGKWHKAVHNAVRLDCIISRDEQRYYIHIINRQQQDAWIQLEAFPSSKSNARLVSIVQDCPWQEHRQRSASRISEQEVDLHLQKNIRVPATSISVCIIDR